MDVEGSRVWFTDLWNYSLVPYLLEAVREGLQVGCGKRKRKKNSLTASSPVVRGVHEVVFICGREELSFSKAEKPRAGSDELVENKALERCDSCTVGRRQVELKQSKPVKDFQKTFCFARL